MTSFEPYAISGLKLWNEIIHLCTYHLFVYNILNTIDMQGLPSAVSNGDTIMTELIFPQLAMVMQWW